MDLKVIIKKKYIYILFICTNKLKKKKKNI